jgi:hypothetical protein
MTTTIFQFDPQRRRQKKGRTEGMRPCFPVRSQDLQPIRFEGETAGFISGAGGSGYDDGEWELVLLLNKPNRQKRVRNRPTPRRISPPLYVRDQA